MEVVSPLGTWACDETGLHPVCLGESQEFLDFWKNRPNVDWIRSAIETDAGYKPYFLSRSEIGDYESWTRDYARCQFLSSNTVLDMDRNGVALTEHSECCSRVAIKHL